MGYYKDSFIIPEIFTHCFLVVDIEAALPFPNHVTQETAKMKSSFSPNQRP